MADETKKSPETTDGETTRPGGGAREPRTGDRIIDGRLDPDAQSPADESGKPFDPNENEPA
ncbi:hypothetical protein FF100_14410 [Methylobacterium terricola]|uniref:Uncharacterized protein n=1 Tax=Methylobacterium terricola TaxID=2583531 RepID=A0A5C4LI67_9HYPH|nr:hypothetical protein [Methylobacterium terricola]TNC12845.1 hypothetical protein FF100_14410 [Methylobacterium terricola]